MKNLVGQKRRGFNLLEVVIAAFIFSTVSVAFLGVWGIQARALAKSRNELAGTKLAEMKIEQALQQGYDGIAATRDKGAPESEDVYPPEDSTPLLVVHETRGAQGDWAEISTKFNHRTSVVEIGSDDDRLKKVKVTVDWDGAPGGEIVLVTYLAGEF